jgi:hypothetical protein
MQGHPFSFRESSLKGNQVTLITTTGLPHYFINFVNTLPDRVDIPGDVVDRADAELLSFVQTTELALVPRAVSGDPEQQAPRLTRRPDRAELKALVFFIWPFMGQSFPLRKGLRWTSILAGFMVYPNPSTFTSP